jgi:hypothetical protein
MCWPAKAARRYFEEDGTSATASTGLGQPADQFTVHYSDFDRDLDRDFDHDLDRDFVKRRAA